MSRHCDRCSICEGKTTHFDNALVLGRYEAEYVRCQDCGFLQVRNPIWLPQAYGEATIGTDIGSVYRCDLYSKIVKVMIHFFFDFKARFVDYGGGYGLFVRRMRDLGYDFRWYDRYCQNLFAKHFEADISEGQKYELLTAFEVFEHLSNPWEEMQSMASLSDNMIFSTELISMSPPPVETWWYYGRHHGQHIAFFTRQSLEIVAVRLGATLYTNGSNLHLIGKRRISRSVFNVITHPRFSEWFNVLRPMPTRLTEDFEHASAEAIAQARRRNAHD